MKPVAIMEVCPGIVNDGTYEHTMRDNCWSCAPYWEQFPVCPTHGVKLKSSGYCRDCKKYYTIPERLDLSEYRHGGPNG